MRSSFIGLSLLGFALALACETESLAPPADGNGESGRPDMAPDQGGDAPVQQGGQGAGGDRGSAAGESAAGEAPQSGGAAAEGGAPAASCNSGKGATLSGRVHAPNGTLPLSGVKVYVPSTTLDPLPYGASCWRCSLPLPGTPVALATTDDEGRFELENVPVGERVPLVVLSGKWQRTLEIPEVFACQDHELDDDALRLPRSNREGNLPRMALVSGGEDTLECLLRKLGVDEEEFTSSSGSGRIRLFSGKGGITELQGGAASPLAAGSALWSEPELLSVFDLVLLGSETDADEASKPEAARQALYGYAAAGGRVLLQHHSSYFWQAGPEELAGLATFGVGPQLPEPASVRIDTTSARGQALRAWMAARLQGEAGTFSASRVQGDVQSVSPPVQRLLYTQQPASVQAFSVDLPLEGEACGRITATDLLTASGDSVEAFPGGCVSEQLSAQELALAYLVLDLGACL